MAAIVARRFMLVSPVLSGQLAARSLSVSAEMRVRRPSFEGPFPPKRPGNAYMLFVKDRFSQLDQLNTPASNVKVLAEMWKNLDMKEREPYYNQFNKLNKAYKQEMKDFLDEMGDNKKEYLQQLKKYRGQRIRYLSRFRLQKQGLLKPRKLSVINVFISKTVKGKIHSWDEAPAALREAYEQWKKLPESEKKKYADEAAELNKQRMAEYRQRVEAVERAH